MDDLRDILRQVRRIELRARQAVSGIGAGGYRSALRDRAWNSMRYVNIRLATTYA